MHRFLSLALVLAFCMGLSAEEYLWTAGGDGLSLFQESNWTKDGVAAPSGTVDANNPLSFDLRITSGTVGGGGFSPHLALGAHRLFITGGAVVGSASRQAGIHSGIDNTIGSIVLSGGTLACQFIHDIHLSLSANASLTLYSAAPFEGTSIAIDSLFTGEIIIENGVIDEVVQAVLPLIQVSGNAAVLKQNIYLSTLAAGVQISLDERENVRWDDVPTGNKDYTDSPTTNDGPNIIFILMDDMGYGDVGVLWQNEKSSSEKKIQTPHIDQLAHEGCIMTDHYCPAPVCAPSRASLLEGLHQGHASVRNNQFDYPIADDLTLASVLQSAGYRTMHVGKNGVAGGRNNTTAHPLVRGFDQYYGYLYHNQGHIHYPLNGTTVKQAFFSDGYRPIKVGTELTYTTDVFTAKAKQWISTHEETRPEQPFFLYLAYDVPHSALQTAAQPYPAGFGKDSGLQWTGYENIDGTLVETPWVNTAYGTSNSYIPEVYQQTDWSDSEKRYAAMIERVDNAIADLLQTLDDYGIDDNTMIVFSSDNGNHKEGGHNPRTFESFADAVGIKRDLTEGGIRMPLIVRYPDLVPAGSESNFNSGFWDWLATFADVAGAPIPARTDGVSLLPTLAQKGEQVDKGYTYIEYFNSDILPDWTEFGTHAGRKRQEMQMIRMGDFKGLRYNIGVHSDAFEIYDVAHDRAETTNLAAAMPQLQQQMKDKVLQVRTVNEEASRPYDDELIPAVDITVTGQGLEANYYEGSYDYVPNFAYLEAESSRLVSNFDFSQRTTNKAIGFMFSAYINVPSDGLYTFYAQSSSHYHIQLHAIHLLNDDVNFSGAEKSASLHLEAGYHPITVYCQQNDDAVPSFSLQLSGPTTPKAPISGAMCVQGEPLISRLMEESAAANIVVYPTLVNDETYVTFAQEQSAQYTVFLYSLLGNEIGGEPYTIDASLGMARIATSHLAAGLYLLSIQDAEGTVCLQTKIIKL